MTPYLPPTIRKWVDALPHTVDQTGRSGAQVLCFPNCVLKIRPDNALARRESALLRWLDGRLPAPEIIESVQEDGTDYLLMTRLSGQMLCEPNYLDQPERLCELLAEGMHMLHHTDTAGCPVDRRLDVVLTEAEAHVRQGLCNADGYKDFGSAANLLDWLVRNKPAENLTLTHGDCCLPNILADSHGVSGLIDLGDGGLADPYIDYSLCWKSLENNLNGFFGGPVRPVPDKQLLFDCLGVTPDWDKLEYYLLLDRLYW